MVFCTAASSYCGMIQLCRPVDTCRCCTIIRWTLTITFFVNNSLEYYHYYQWAIWSQQRLSNLSNTQLWLNLFAALVKEIHLVVMKSVEHRHYNWVGSCNTVLLASSSTWQHYNVVQTLHCTVHSSLYSTLCTIWTKTHFTVTNNVLRDTLCFNKSGAKILQ